MSRYTGPVCKLCRREQEKLFLKGDRCNTPKCAMDPNNRNHRNYAPGQHGPIARRRTTAYSVQLREKQKLRRIYGVTERVFRSYFSKATRQEGIAGDNFLRILERRLDNVVYRLGFTTSRPAARQLVAHGNISVNGRKVDIPSFLVKPGMVIELNEKIANQEFIQNSLNSARVRKAPAWLKLDDAKAKGEVINLPNRDEIAIVINEKVIVEYYNRMG